ncbi:MAG TPA: flagellar export chaperone FliS [Phycisphaerae bacterium]|jgi:flagellar protein FliS
MSHPAPNTYLQQAVLSATPEQLQLMLYDGAIRFALQGRDALLAKQWEAVYEKFSRAQKIILEMQAGLRRDHNAELCDQMAAIYGFLYRKLVDAAVKRDVQAVDDALQVLRYQRETWVMLMQRVSAERAGVEGPALASAGEPAPSGGRLSLEC